MHFLINCFRRSLTNYDIVRVLLVTSTPCVTRLLFVQHDVADVRCWSRLLETETRETNWRCSYRHIELQCCRVSRANVCKFDVEK